MHRMVDEPAHAERSHARDCRCHEQSSREEESEPAVRKKLMKPRVQRTSRDRTQSGDEELGRDQPGDGLAAGGNTASRASDAMAARATVRATTTIRLRRRIRLTSVMAGTCAAWATNEIDAITPICKGLAPRKRANEVRTTPPESAPVKLAHAESMTSARCALGRSASGNSGLSLSVLIGDRGNRGDGARVCQMPACRSVGAPRCSADGLRQCKHRWSRDVGLGFGP